MQDSNKKICTQCKRDDGEFYSKGIKGRNYNHTWCKSCLNSARKKALLREKIEIIFCYSNGEMKCNCCGEDNLGFLCIDHINNDGASHRKSLATSKSGIVSGSATYRWIRKNNYPKNMFQVLCFNCNSSKSMCGGVCYHKHTEKQIAHKQALVEICKPVCIVPLKAKKVTGKLSDDRPNRRKVLRPSKEELQEMKRIMSWRAIGRKYGVRDNSVRRWAKRYNLL